jgi:hypothetical protein
MAEALCAGALLWCNTTRCARLPNFLGIPFSKTGLVDIESEIYFGVWGNGTDGCTTNIADYRDEHQFFGMFVSVIFRSRVRAHFLFTFMIHFPTTIHMAHMNPCFINRNNIFPFVTFYPLQESRTIEHPLTHYFV